MFKFSSNHVTTNKNDLEISFVLCDPEKKDKKKKKVTFPTGVRMRINTDRPLLTDWADHIKMIKFQVSLPLTSSLILIYSRGRIR